MSALSPSSRSMWGVPTVIAGLALGTFGADLLDCAKPDAETASAAMSSNLLWDMQELLSDETVTEGGTKVVNVRLPQTRLARLHGSRRRTAGAQEGKDVAGEATGMIVEDRKSVV